VQGSATAVRWNSTIPKPSSGERGGWKRRADAGIAFEHVRGQRLEELQPGLSPRLLPELSYRYGRQSPSRRPLPGALWAHAERHGATFEKAEVRGLEQNGAKPSLRLADGSIREADKIVICAGAWSARLLRTITKLRIPLETERGYNTTLPNGAFDVKRQLDFWQSWLRHHAARNRRPGRRRGGACRA
jgi:D-amino-acid dehydrogenase